MAFFNAALASDIEDEAHNPLVDWNCDGLIDCDDRTQFLANWPESTGVDSCP